MRNLLLLILLISFIILFSSCTSTYPWAKNPTIPIGKGFTVLEDLSPSLKLNGVYAYSLEKGGHKYIFMDIGYAISLIHDEECENHEVRLMDRAKENQLRRDGF